MCTSVPKQFLKSFVLVIQGLWYTNRKHVFRRVIFQSKNGRVCHMSSFKLCLILHQSIPSRNSTCLDGFIVGEGGRTCTVFNFELYEVVYYIFVLHEQTSS